MATFEKLLLRVNDVNVSIQDCLSSKLQLTAILFAWKWPLLQVNFIDMSNQFSLECKLHLAALLFARERLFLMINSGNMVIQMILAPKFLLTTIFLTWERSLFEANKSNVGIQATRTPIQRPILGLSFLHAAFTRIFFFKMSAWCRFHQLIISWPILVAVQWQLDFLQVSLLFLLGIETTLFKTPNFQWIYGKLSQIYEKLWSDSFEIPQTQPNPRTVY